MAKGRREIAPCCKTYGLPLYCAAWVPVDRLSDAAAAAAEDDDKSKDEADQETVTEGGGGGREEPEPSASKRDQLVLALGGGGGEGRSGVPNALILAQFDFDTQSLSDQPVCRLGTDGEVPYRMAMHPGGDGIICSLPNSCRWFDWEFPKTKEANKLALKSSGKILTQLEDVGLQLALAFNAEGSMLAAGGEDGHLRVFKWPSMETVLDQADAHTTVKDLHFSSDAKYLVSLGSSGPCRVWDLTSSTVAASLQRETGEMFGFCRFSQSSDNEQIIYVTAMHGAHGKVISWNANSWKRIGSKKMTSDPISAFSVSADGKFLAIGTIEGKVVIINSDMQVLTSVKKAHLGLVTALIFSQDSRALISTSFDSTVRVTLFEGRKNNGLSMWLIVLIILLSFLVYFIKFKEGL